jgi:Methylamine utilisation protein MauE
MRRDTLARSLALVGRVGVAALLLVAALFKLRAPTEFAGQIANYQLVPAAAPYLAASLPMAELVVGLSLLAAPRVWRRAAAAAALVMFAMFEVAVCSAYLRHINIDCGCFGAGGGPITFVTILRNAALIGVTAALVRWDDRHNQSSAAPATSP